MSLRFFTDEEFACSCCGESKVQTKVKYALDFARGVAGIPFTITSGYRCVDHNIQVGGSATSSHLNGTAVDIACNDSSSRYKIITALLDAGFHRIGVADTFIHADMDRDKPERVMWTY